MWKRSEVYDNGYIYPSIYILYRIGFLCGFEHVLFSYTFVSYTCNNISIVIIALYLTQKKKAPLKAGFYCYTSFEYLPETYLFLFSYFIPFQLFTVSPV